MFDPDSIANLIFPDIPPPLPPRKKMTNRMKKPAGQQGHKYRKGGPTFSRGVSVDLITFEEDTETAKLTPISSENSGTSCSGGFANRNVDRARSQNIVQPKQKQLTGIVHPVSQNVMASLDVYFTDSLFKSLPDPIDDSESETAQYTPDFGNFSTKKDNLLNSSFQKDKIATGLQNPVDNSTVVIDASADSNAAEPQHERHLPDFDTEEYADFVSFNRDSWPKVSDDMDMKRGVNFCSHDDRSWPSNNPFRTGTNFEIITGIPSPKQFERCLQNSEEGVIDASANYNAAEPQHERHLAVFDTQVYDDFVSFSRDAWPTVSDMDMDPFTSGTSETEQQFYELALPHSVIPDNPDSKMQKSELKREEKIENTGSSNESLESQESMEFETKAQPGIAHHREDSSDDDDEDDYIYMSPDRDSDTSSQYRVDTNTSNELQQESQKDESESDEDNDPGLSKARHPRLSAQRSLRDSAIYYDFEDNRARTDVNDKCSKEEQMTKSSRKDNMKSKAKNLWSKVIDRNGKKHQQERPPLGNNLPPQGHGLIKLSCACGGSCERVGSLVTSSEGQMWVSFLDCSWVSLYNNRHILVRKFDAHGIVDSLAVSLTGVLYISCPQYKKILMLSTNLELMTMSQFNKKHPRGLAISPTDGAVVACMTSQASGREMNGPTKNCLMKFSGKSAHEEGKVLNKGDFLGYPLKLAINVNGYILVSDFGLNCMFVLEPGGHMLKKFSNLGDRPYYQVQVHSLTSAHDDSLYVVHGGRGRLSITRLRQQQGTVVEKETSKRVDQDVYCKVRTSAVTQSGQLVVTSGCVVKYVPLDH